MHNFLPRFGQKIEKKKKKKKKNMVETQKKKKKKTLLKMKEQKPDDPFQLIKKLYPLQIIKKVMDHAHILPPPPPTPRRNNERSPGPIT